MTSIPGSSLEAFFSGRHDLAKIEGKIFIDRDPKMFEYLIQYLRDDCKWYDLESKTENARFKNELQYW